MRSRAAIAMIILCAAAVWWMAPSAVELPDFARVRSRWHPSDAQLLDRNGNPVYEMRIDAHGRRLAWTSLDDISPALIAAVLASEDRRFHSHCGVDAIASAAAALRWMTGRRVRGTSTITMQLASMLDPSLARVGHRRSLFEKVRQMRAALALERSWSKREILEAYLNLVVWRGENQGVAAASRAMFAKLPGGITAGEAALMAALLRAPNAGRDAAMRRAIALRARIGSGAPARGDIAAAADRAFSSARARVNPVMLAPHVAARMLGEDRATVRCSLDADLQRVASESLRRRIAEVADRNVDDGAVLVVENATGQVWAYVGGAGRFSPAPWVDGVRAIRQPGSALKPFLYAFAIDRRMLTAASLVEDTPLEVSEERGLYRPMDYDRRFRGLVTVRAALGSSLNIPAVRTIDLVGVDSFADKLRALGIGTVVEEGDYYGAALALGSADVTLWDLVNAYRTLANGGVMSPLTMEAKSGGVREDRRIYSREAAFIVSDILADRAARGETFGLENLLATRYWSAVKTGTSKDMRDNWCVGFTDRFTVGVWVGNVSGGPMRDVTGITGAAPVWLDVMDYLHERYGEDAPEAPDGVVARRVSFANAIEPPRTEWFIRGTEPQVAAVRIDDRSPRVASPADGTIVALDPDIPSDRQRVMFTATRASANVRWVLDGIARGAADRSWMWHPSPGSHTVALIDSAGRTLDSATFVVRGRYTSTSALSMPGGEGGS